MPDPVTDIDGYLAYLVLAGVLTDGDSSRLQQRLVHREGIVIDLNAGCGLFGPFEARDPDARPLLPRLEHEDHVAVDLIRSLAEQHPATESQLFSEDGELNRYVNVYLNDEDVRVLDGLDTPVKESDTLVILPAMAGGSH